MSHLIVMLLSPQRERIVSIDGGRQISFMAPYGAVEVFPQSTDLFARWNVPVDGLLFAIDDARLKQIASLAYQDAEFDLYPPSLPHIDKDALQIGNAICRETLLGSTASKISFESLITVLGVHILRRYSSLGQQRRECSRYGGLTQHAWRSVDDFIRSHLDEDLSISVLADKVGFSVSHFMRAFHREVGVTPHRYIMRLRVELAEQLVTTTDLPLNSIAVRCGFASNSHMTAIFRKMTGSLPSHLRRMKSTQKHLSRHLALQVERQN